MRKPLLPLTAALGQQMMFDGLDEVLDYQG